MENKEGSKYKFVIISPDLSTARLHVTPSHGSHLVGAQGSPFQPILSGTFRDILNACMAMAASKVLESIL
jgi:hypothetical protein